MSTAPTITYLQLDPENNIIFDPNSQLADQLAVTQAIRTRLSLFLGEWWENLSLGLPVFQQILGQLGTRKGQAAFKLVIQQNISGAPFVTAVQNVEASFIDGQFRYQATAITAFGPIVITNTPGASASLDTAL